MSNREEILAKVRAVPAIPSAATKVIDLLKDPEVEISELTQVIEFEPGLTSNVLRLANSAYFAGPHSIGSLKDAIIRLGMNRIFQLVITSAIAPMTRMATRGYDLPAGELLEHSVGVAIGAEQLAKALGRRPPPTAFTAGLLHDLGKILLGTFVEVDVKPITELAFRENISFEVAEFTVLGIDHAEAGAALLEFWGLPQDIIEAVRWHHDPDRIEGDTFVADLVHVADALALSSGLGAGVDGLNYRASDAVMARLKVDTDTAEAVVCNILEGIDGLRELFGTAGGR